MAVAMAVMEAASSRGRKRGARGIGSGIYVGFDGSLKKNTTLALTAHLKAEKQRRARATAARLAQEDLS